MQVIRYALGRQSNIVDKPVLIVQEPTQGEKKFGKQQVLWTGL